MTLTWEWTIARPMLLLHMISGCGALAITIHVLWFIWRGRDRKAVAHRMRARRYAAVTWPMYLSAVITGALVYPAYKVGVRAGEDGMDATDPFMTGLFEIKEHWAALGLFLVWALWYFLCRPKRDPLIDPDRRFWVGQAAITLIAAICALANVIIGTWVVMVRSV